jgi:hypothetical protein
MITGATHAFNSTALEASERSSRGDQARPRRRLSRCSPIGLGFKFLSPFAASRFRVGRLRPTVTAIRFLAALAHLELGRRD